MACIPVLFPRSAQAEDISPDLPIVVDVDAVADAAEGINEEDVEKVVAKPKLKKSKVQSKKTTKPKKTTKSATKAKPKIAQKKKDTKKSKPKSASTKRDGAAPKKLASTTKKSKSIALSKPRKVETTKDEAHADPVEPKSAKKLNKKPRRPLKRRMKQS